MQNLLLTNLSKGWFSLALRSTGTRAELKQKEFIVLQNISKEDVTYYSQFVPLGISMKILDSEPSVDVNIDTNEEDIPNINDKELEDAPKGDVLEQGMQDTEVVVPKADVVETDDKEALKEEYKKLTIRKLRELLDNFNIAYRKDDNKTELIDKLVG